MTLTDYLVKLVEIPTVSGYESRHGQDVIRLTQQYVEDWFDEVETLPSGSLLFKKFSKKPNAKKLVLDAHMDTVGFAVKEYCGDGFVKVTALGGINPYILPATPVYIDGDHGDSTFYGVFSSVPPHLAKKTDEGLKLENLYVDTGLDEDFLKQHVPIGTPCRYAQTPNFLLNQVLASPSMDDKACVACILGACKLLKKESLDCDVYVHLAVGEEKTLLGAKTLPYAVEADGAIVLDVNFATTADVKPYESLVLGKGPGVSLSATTNRKFTDFILDVANTEHIPCQSVVEMCSTGTNAIMMHRHGIPCAVLSVALKNMHTFCECVSLDDIETCAKLLKATVLKFPESNACEKVVYQA